MSDTSVCIKILIDCLNRIDPTPQRVKYIENYLSKKPRTKEHSQKDDKIQKVRADTAVGKQSDKKSNFCFKMTMYVLNLSNTKCTFATCTRTHPTVHTKTQEFKSWFNNNEVALMANNKIKADARKLKTKIFSMKDE